jgi:dTDP-4-amino-4,6-dideoxygalactose transaminase
MFANTAVKAPWRSPETYSAFHLYIVRVNFSACGTTQKQVFEDLHANHIQANLHYIPIYRQPYYQQFGYLREDFPESEKYYSEAISLPMYPGLSSADQGFVAQTLLSALGD